jgi:hypothetical protein
LLIVLGALVLAYQGIDNARQKDVLDVGSVHITKETHERIPIPPILGGLTLVGGIVLMVVGARNNSLGWTRDRAISALCQGTDEVKSMTEILGHKLKGDFRCYC